MSLEETIENEPVDPHHMMVAGTSGLAGYLWAIHSFAYFAGAAYLLPLTCAAVGYYAAKSVKE